MGYLARRHVESVKELQAWLESYIGTVRTLTGASLHAIELGNFSYGWVWPRWPDGEGSLCLLVESNFPYSAPRVAILDAPGTKTWPHVEHNGLLCLFGDDPNVDTLSPLDVAKQTILAAEQLLNENAYGKHNVDWLVDFEAYWRRDLANEAFNLTTIVEHKPPSRMIAVAPAHNRLWAAEDAAQLDRFVKNLFHKQLSAPIKEGALVWVNQLPTPDQYPSSPEGFRKWVGANSDSGLHYVDKLLQKPTSTPIVLLLGMTPVGRVGSAAVKLRARDQNTRRARRPVREPFSKGFRPGKVPAKVSASRYRLSRGTVASVNTMESRYPPKMKDRLDGKGVVVIGCGSLGSTIARILAQSGVPRLLLIDPETVEWGNIGRHELGADSVGRKKSAELASRIASRIPHVESIESRETDWINSMRDEPDLFNEYDLVISTVGAWGPESALNDLHVMGDIETPLIFGWVEHMVSAAHAVSLRGAGACLRCGFDDLGGPHTPATIWPNSEKLVRECGGATTVFGAAELAHAHGLIATLAIDQLVDQTAPEIRTWLGPEADLYKQGGAWSDSWIEKFGHPAGGNKTVIRPWTPDPECRLCSQVRL